MSAGLHISVSAETITYIAGIPISNSILTSLIVSGLLILFAIFAKKKIDTKNIYGRPSAFQNFCEMIIEGLYSFVHSVTKNKKKTDFFLPFIASFFLFILMNNWLGLLPGMGTIGLTSHPKEASLPAIEVQASDVVAAPSEDHAEEVMAGYEENSHDEGKAAEGHDKKVFIPLFRAGTADINTTLALALISVIMTQFIGFKYLKLGYLKKYFNFSNPIMFFVGLLEMVSEVAKIISFAFRLFGNIFAGEVLLAVMLFLVPLIAPMPFYGLEIFVGFIQALVFSMLTLVFFDMATVSHDEH
jgi:F-type H+-transporting ATPase subunit a